ncbi:MAG: RNA polymerase sigma factor RpoD/SigA [Bdellovibrionales bacterium]
MPGKKKPIKAKKSRSKSLKGFKKVEAQIVEEPKELAEEGPGPEEIPPEESADFDFPEVEAPVSSSSLTTTDPVTRYMAEIGRYPLLSREQEHALAVRYRETGDPKAAEALVTSNLRFVVKVASEYTKFGAKLIDLVQEGNVGLMHAVKEFNPYKGVRLITYAVWWIRGYIQEYLMRQYSMVRIGTTAAQRKLFYQLQREREQLERMGVDKGIAQISGRLGIPEEDVHEMHARVTGRDLSLDAPVGENSSLMDFQTAEDPSNLVEAIGTKEELSQLMSGIDQLRPTLSEKETFLLEERLLADEPLTLQEIGDKYGTTREAVRQMENRLIEKIKKSVQAE